MRKMINNKYCDIGRPPARPRFQTLFQLAITQVSFLTQQREATKQKFCVKMFVAFCIKHERHIWTLQLDIFVQFGWNLSLSNFYLVMLILLSAVLSWCVVTSMTMTNGDGDVVRFSSCFVFFSWDLASANSGLTSSTELD